MVDKAFDVFSHTMDGSNSFAGAEQRKLHLDLPLPQEEIKANRKMGHLTVIQK